MGEMAQTDLCSQIDIFEPYCLANNCVIACDIYLSLTRVEHNLNALSSYDKGAHMFLPSYVMRIYGAKQQREAVKRASRKQLQAVFEALDTLGNTRWRVNKRVLSVVDRIWSNGRCLADLVDHSDASIISNFPQCSL
ncbi:hypothetical protein D5086_030832 [Populus alba]|uniref:Uncharacterized protein n=1 Tax=Populus alba TaxID=43335 RepID=A0ACC4APT2_POPAL